MSKIQKKYVRRDVALHFKKDKKCCYCGYCIDSSALQYHHIDSKSKSFNLSDIPSGSEFLIVALEICKTTIICSNCHLIYHNSTNVVLVSEIEQSFVPINYTDFEEFCINIDNLYTKKISLSQYKKTKKGKEAYEIINITEKEVIKINHSTVDTVGRMTNAQKTEIISYYESTKSFKQTSELMWGVGKYGKFYNDIIRFVIQQ